MDQRDNIYVETRMGRMVSLLDPEPETICLQDIAASLANINRFNGHCHTQHNVADHSIAVAIAAKRFSYDAQGQLAALLHDAHEAYIGDLSSPMKAYLKVHCPGVIEALQENFDRVIWEALCPGVPIYDGTALKQIDDMLLNDEAGRLMHPDGVGRSWKVQPAGVTPLAFSMRSPEAAEAKFITVFNRLFAEATVEQAADNDACEELSGIMDEDDTVPGRPELTGGHPDDEPDDEPGEYSEAE